jgi:acyl carrier protein
LPANDNDAVLPAASLLDAQESDASVAPGAGANRAEGRSVSPPLDMDEQQIRAQLRQWILEHAKAPARGGELTDQTPILESGLISSLDVVEFVLFIEELRGEEIETDDIEPEVFTSVDTLWEGFFAPQA